MRPFSNLCEVTAMMRAYDVTLGTWSNSLIIEPACTDEINAIG
jgi:hypothetical protein